MFIVDSVEKPPSFWKTHFARTDCAKNFARKCPINDFDFWRRCFDDLFRCPFLITWGSSTESTINRSPLRGLRTWLRPSGITPLILILTMILSVQHPGAAATKTWDGSSSGNWATAANWSGSTLPVAGDDLVFPGA